MRVTIPRLAPESCVRSSGTSSSQPTRSAPMPARRAVVSGSTSAATRRLVIERFKRAELRVLCNCEVLTTGFDAPRVTHVVMARPTVSQVLYEQMVGRGPRGVKFGGTQVCTILD